MEFLETRERKKKIFIYLKVVREFGSFVKILLRVVSSVSKVQTSTTMGLFSECSEENYICVFVSCETSGVRPLKYERTPIYSTCFI